MVDAICERIATGERLIAVCRRKGMPSAPTFWRWLSEDPAFARKYDLALTMRAHIFAEGQELTGPMAASRDVERGAGRAGST